ncbi:MAG: SAM-dependent chlorinase/fluorinase, partial [Dehalococcoidia bacterium]
TERPAIVIATPAGTFVGPDNGVLSAALPDEARAAVAGQTGAVPLPAGTECHLLANRAFHREAVSNTFHGRDIFAPVAAHLSQGVRLEELGPAVPEVTALPPFRARPQPDGSLLGLVRHVDHFGNLVSDVRVEQLPPPPLLVEIGGRRIHGLSETYGRGEGLLALIGSSGLLEIAMHQRSASADLDAGIGEPVTVRPA